MNEKYVSNFRKLIAKETVSFIGQRDLTKFREFHALLAETFPNLWAALDSCEDFDGSLLLCWKGSDASLPPVLFMNHHDVVAADGSWSHEPFAAELADGKIWGRGTLDTKAGLWGMLQAADDLAAEGFTPQRDIYFESGCNEETNGAGAERISRILQERGIRFSMVLDEGGYILEEPIGGAKGTYAMIGVGEKGYAELKFVAKSSGGHASTPGKDTPLVRLGKFMAEADQAKIFDVEISPVIREMFLRLGPNMQGILKTVLSHPDPFAFLIRKIMPGTSPTAAALLRTTLAFTMAEGSEGRNVLPQEAYVIGNMRYSHHQGCENSIQAVRRLAEKYDVETEVLDAGFSSPLSDPHSREFQKIEAAVHAVFPGVIPSPYVMTGASDARFMSRVSDNCFRFCPFLISEEQMHSIHGLNENIDADTLESAVRFYQYLMREA